ncbi:putative to be involved in ER-Golgi transport [Trypanosoma theileri]|uniref:Putative to be involved in ER-Golgi transport n=1 Tax=Trypanosoma theileri TaxID=67003 RepID=A0A1X0P7B1_9TRYP|nr:putative to be involved in ER-Golgi transport [Trypanosoma theileri]ORC92758.1 putative to be involved in ER-Golgi transport [Trypanosoma theileri]
MDSLYNWNDSTKIGVALTGLGAFFTFLGIIMLLDSVLLTMGNILFVAGVALVMGPKRFKAFFLARRRASGCFFVGILLIIAGFCFTGLIIQGFGALNLFGNFFPMIARVLESVPFLGPVMLSSPVQRLLACLGLHGHRSRNV